MKYLLLNGRYFVLGSREAELRKQNGGISGRFSVVDCVEKRGD